MPPVPNSWQRHNKTSVHRKYLPAFKKWWNRFGLYFCHMRKIHVCHSLQCRFRHCTFQRLEWSVGGHAHGNLTSRHCCVTTTPNTTSLYSNTVYKCRMSILNVTVGLIIQRRWMLTRGINMAVLQLRNTLNLNVTWDSRLQTQLFVTSQSNEQSNTFSDIL